jgi:hypothetical protein
MSVAHELGVISDRQCPYLLMQLSLKSWRSKEPIAIDPETPRLLKG